MKKKTLLLSALGVILASVIGVASYIVIERNKPEAVVTVTKPKLEGNMLINGFDKLDDLYAVKWIDAYYSSVGQLDIDTNADMVQEGTGCLRFDLKRTTTYPELHIKTYNTLVPDMDVARIKTYSTWIYNASEKEAVVSLNLMQKGNTHLLSQEFTLPAQEWTECVMYVNGVVTKYAAENVTGFSVQFKVMVHPDSTDEETLQTATFYLDNMQVEFGNAITKEDQVYVDTIEKLIADIDSLPVDITSDDEAKLSELYATYNNLPDEYKAAVSNYSSLQTAISGIVSARDREETNKDTAALERSVFYFDKFYGTTQIKNTENSKCVFGYSTDYKYGDEEGSLRIGLVEEIWNYVTITTTADLKEYDYVRYAMYNDGEEKAVWLNAGGWNCRAQLLPGQWYEFEIPTSYFNTSGVEFVITESVNGGTAAPAEGDLYISAITAYKLSGKDLYKAALKDTPFTVKRKAGSMSVGNNVTVTATKQGDLVLALNKSVTELSAAENVIFSYKSQRGGVITLLDDKELKLAKNATISIAEGWNTIILTAEQYAQAGSIRINMDEGEQVVFTDFRVFKIADTEAMLLLMEYDYLPQNANLKKSDLPALIKYVSIYNENTYKDLNSKLHGQFVKVTKTADSALYEKQSKVWKSVIDRVSEKANIAKTLMTTLINDVKSKGAEEDIYLLNEVYGSYTSSRTLPGLSSEQKKTATTLIEKYSDLPQRFVDVSEAVDRAKLSVVTKYFPWTGKLTKAEDASYGTVLKIQPTGNSARANGETHENIELSHYQPDLAGYRTVRFKVYNSGPARTLYFITDGWGATVCKYTLASNAWTEISISADDYKTAATMLIDGVSKGNLADSFFYFTDFKAYK